MILLLMLIVFVLVVIIVHYYKCKIRNIYVKPKNKVHFYVARDIDGDLWLYLGKPERWRYRNSYRTCGCGTLMINERHFNDFGINSDDFKDLKRGDKPVEVFINMEE